MIIPDAVRNDFFDNPIGGLAMNLVGPLSLRLAFRAFIAVVGTLMLAGAVNTAIVGSIGVLNRVSEDGILPHWFRHPHRRFGTTSLSKNSNTNSAMPTGRRPFAGSSSISKKSKIDGISIPDNQNPYTFLTRPRVDYAPH